MCVSPEQRELVDLESAMPTTQEPEFRGSEVLDENEMCCACGKEALQGWMCSMANCDHSMCVVCIQDCESHGVPANVCACHVNASSQGVDSASHNCASHIAPVLPRRDPFRYDMKASASSAPAAMNEPVRVVQHEPGSFVMEPKFVAGMPYSPVHVPMMNYQYLGNVPPGIPRQYGGPPPPSYPNMYAGTQMPFQGYPGVFGQRVGNPGGPGDGGGSEPSSGGVGGPGGGGPPGGGPGGGGAGGNGGPGGGAPSGNESSASGRRWRRNAGSPGGGGGGPPGGGGGGDDDGEASSVSTNSQNPFGGLHALAAALMQNVAAQQEANKEHK